MAKKAKQRFSWKRNATTGIAVKIDGDTGDKMEIGLGQFPQVIQQEIAVYGLSKIVDDRLSQVPASMKIAEAVKLVAQFIAGNWKAERTGGIHLLPLVIDAIILEKGCSVTQAQAAYRLLDDEQKIVLKEALATRMAEVAEARKGADEVTLDDLI